MSYLSFISSRLRGSTSPPHRGIRVVEGVGIEDIASKEALLAGWHRVRANKGGPGGDSVTIEEFSQGLEDKIGRLARQLINDSYRPRALRRAAVPKEGGGQRWLSIPAVVDRVVQSAALEALTPLLEPRMSEASWAYRPGRGVADALTQLEVIFDDGYVWTVDADIASYFDNVPHRRLIEELTIWIDDERVIRLFGRWIKGFNRAGRGIAQGSPISPLLANLYLHPIDRLIKAEGYPIVRYADDLVIMARSEAEVRRAHQLLQELLWSRGLRLNSGKTKIRGPNEAFRFLGADVRAKSSGRAHAQ